MAFVAVEQSGDERRLPDRLETVLRRQHRQAIEAGVDEDRPVVRVDADVVQIELAGEAEGRGT